MELDHGSAHMGLCRGRADKKRLADFGVAQPFADQGHHFSFTFGQFVQLIVSHRFAIWTSRDLFDQSPCDRWRQQRFALGGVSSLDFDGRMLLASGSYDDGVRL